MRRGFVSALATNGAGIIHDFEIALAGSTSEDVDEALRPGGSEFRDGDEREPGPMPRVALATTSAAAGTPHLVDAHRRAPAQRVPVFRQRHLSETPPSDYLLPSIHAVSRSALAEETGTLLNRAIRRRRTWVGAAARASDRPFGAYLRQSRAPHADLSVAATAAELGIPLTVHVAIGTDIIHMHPAASGAALGEGSLRDFRYFVSNVARLDGGVYLNCGSAVVLPEVFLKAVALARNQGRPPYRPDDREHRLRPALSPSDQRRVSPHRRHRPRLLPRRPPRAADPATGRGADRIRGIRVIPQSAICNLQSAICNYRISIASP